MKAIKTKSGRTYTKRQIQEAIRVWESRLRKLDGCSCRKTNESAGVWQTMLRRAIDYKHRANDPLGKELAAMKDVPNYLKDYIWEYIRQHGDDRLTPQAMVDRLAKERVVEVDGMIWDDGASEDSTAVQIPNDRLPLKFSHDDVDRELRRMFPDRKDVTASGMSIKFPESGIGFYCAEEEWTGNPIGDRKWSRNIAFGKRLCPLALGPDGDAARIDWNGGKPYQW